MKFKEYLDGYLTEENTIGKTSEDEDHTHTYEVEGNGNGKTSLNNGHLHDIVEYEVQPAGKNNHIHTLMKE